MEAPASYQKVLEEHAAGHSTSAEDQSHIFYGAAVESMKSGDCDKSVKLLNRACVLAGGILSTRGGEMRLWLALALDAARRRSEALPLLTALESHPDGDVRTAAKELAFVFQAPELEWENASHVSIDIDTFDDDVNVRRESEEGIFAPRAPETEAEGDASEEAPAPEPKRARTIDASAAGPRAADVETDYHRLYLRLYPRDGTRYVSFLRSMLARPEAPELLGLSPPRNAERGADAARGDSTSEPAAWTPARVRWVVTWLPAETTAMDKYPKLNTKSFKGLSSEIAKKPQTGNQGARDVKTYLAADVDALVARHAAPEPETVDPRWREVEAGTLHTERRRWSGTRT
ncbi:hypothetical protein JL722_7574 [Aureococcus anophagefferens]|nr:hypothetical protein JL722_7574 [Aureococcus anophagefferens]